MTRHLPLTSPLLEPPTCAKSAWTAWYTMWAEKQDLMNRIREVGNRFRAPEKASAFSFWFSDMQATKLAEERAEFERQSKSLEAQLRRARFEAGQAEMVKVAKEEEIERLKEKVGAITTDSSSIRSPHTNTQTLRLSRTHSPASHALCTQLSPRLPPSIVTRHPAG